MNESNKQNQEKKKALRPIALGMADKDQLKWLQVDTQSSPFSFVY